MVPSLKGAYIEPIGDKFGWCAAGLIGTAGVNQYACRLIAQLGFFPILSNYSNIMNFLGCVSVRHIT
jgi:hypothetical protein